MKKIYTAFTTSWQLVVATLMGGNPNGGFRPEEGVVYMATHHITGGRAWEFAPGADPEFLSDELSGGWWVIREGEAYSLTLRSASSGSQIDAVRQDGGWNLRLEVPMEADGPYRGQYYRAFHGAVGHLLLEEERGNDRDLSFQEIEMAFG